MTNGKSVHSTAVEKHTYKVFPHDLNSNGTVFGGLVMAQCDRIALVVAERHSGSECVTVSVDAMHFLAPARVGDNLLISCCVNRAWNSSMELGVRVDAENRQLRTITHIVSAYFTFVAVDKNNKPVPVPALILETADQQRRYEEAEIRKKNRLLAAAEQKKRRSKP